MELDIINVSQIYFDNETTELATERMTISTSGFWGQEDSIISNTVASIIQIAVTIVTCGVISIAGLVANVINVVVFWRHGVLSSSSNVSLLALAFADSGCLLPVFCNSVAHGIMHIIQPEGIFLTRWDFTDIAIVWTRYLFVHISNWIMAYIAFERCMCVVFPLKMKTLFTAKRSLFVVVTIAVLFTLSFIPIYSSLRLVGMQDPVTNRTKQMFFPSKSFREAATISDYIHSLALRNLAIAVVFFSAQITVYQLKRSKTRRKTMTMRKNESSKPNQKKINDLNKTMSPTEKKPVTANYVNDENETIENKSTTKQKTCSRFKKERRLIRMMIAMSAIFLACSIPEIVTVIALHYVPIFKELTLSDNVFRIILSAQYCMESINSSINIVIYYRMSSLYKQTFRVWLGLDKRNPSLNSSSCQ